MEMGGHGMSPDTQMEMDMDMPIGLDMVILHEPPNWGFIRLNKVGTIYVVVFCIWTIIFAIGFAILWSHRKLPFIRLKNIPLVSWALAFLHIQLSFDILAYPLNGTLPCNLEYWIMAICLPSGIALFQAQNMQLLSMFWGQKQFRLQYTTGVGSLQDWSKHRNYFVRFWHWWQCTCYLRRTYYIIGLGTGIQLICAVVIFLISRRFHPSFGLVSMAPISDFECRAGWEWFGSGIWQAIWTYGFGPFILFKIRKIRDTHRWRLQTTLAILFSLPALPLWLSTWFMEDFYIVNEHWPPNMWFVPGIGMMEFVILFFPIFEIYEYKRRHKRLSGISNQHPNLNVTFSTKYTQRALELTLESPAANELEEFATTKDFTGENIIFLRKVASWKKKWILSEQNSVGGMIRAPVIRALYDTAEQIYFQSISRVHSTFPLNLEDDIYLPLAGMFCGETSASSNHIYPIGCPPPTDPSYHNLLNSFSQYNANQNLHKSQIAPFADDVSLLHRQPPQTSTTARTPNRPLPKRWKWEFPPPLPTAPPQPKRVYTDECPPTPPRKNSIPGWEFLPPPQLPGGGIRRGSESTLCEGEAIPIIPPSFTVEVFDRAERAVMNMVLMNTWIRYVDSLSLAEQLEIEERALSSSNGSSSNSDVSIIKRELFGDSNSGNDSSITITKPKPASLASGGVGIGIGSMWKKSSSALKKKEQPQPQQQRTLCDV